MSEQILEAKTQVLSMIARGGGAMSPRALAAALPAFDRRMLTQAIQLAFERGEIRVDEQMRLVVPQDVMQAA